MDGTDILIIIITIAVTIVTCKFLPNNPLSMLVKYIKNLFSYKS